MESTMARVGTNNGRFKHGLCKTRLYSIWSGMKTRCENPNNKRYKNYGGKGIRLCDEWRNSFEGFVLWSLSNGYSHELSIDRIDNDGNYEPRNCRWANYETQSRNQGVRKDNLSGIRGVRYRKDCNKWQSRISACGKSICLGSFDTKDEAVKARLAGEARYWTEYKDTCDYWEER